MRKIILGIILSGILSVSAYAQNDSIQVETRINQLEKRFHQLQRMSSELQTELQVLRNTDSSLQRGVFDLSNKNEKLSARLDSLNGLLTQNSNTINDLTQKLTGQNEELSTRLDSLKGLLIQNKDAVNDLNQQLAEQKQELSGQISETREATSQSVSELDEALSKNTLYWIIAVLAVGLLSILAFIFLRKKVSANQSSITESLASTRRELEQEALRLDEKLIGVMETQMKLIQEERKATPENQNGEPDHSLALKVADEIVRIEKNISQMDEGTRGLKQLAKAVTRIRDNFASNGYEMVDMIGKPFDDGMKVTANFRPDENLERGQKVITRIIKPQVNYKGEMIQSAQVEVSQGE